MTLLSSSKTTFISISYLLLLLLATATAGDPVAGGSYIRPPSGNSGGGVGGGECEQTYGFLPCTTTVLGNMFLIVVYGYLMYMAATFLSNGSELLLEILGPGIVGGLFLPILGALPDAMLILAQANLDRVKIGVMSSGYIHVSGLSGSISEAQSQVSVGMGLLAGSTVMLLTVIWGTCIFVGKCDLERSRAVDETDTKGFDLFGSGVSTDIWTSYAARIMAISVLPFLVVQLPQALNSTSGRHLAVLIALIFSVLLLVCYCLFQIVQPWIQVRRIDYVKHKRVLTGFLQHLKKHALGKLCNHDGTPNRDILAKLFESIDDDGDKRLSKRELRAFIIGMRFEGLNIGEEDIADRLMKEFDTERPDGTIDLDEFVEGISKLLAIIRGDEVSHHNADTFKYLDAYDEEAKIEHSLLGDASDEATEEVEDPKKTTIKAILFLVLGTLIAAAFADPLVDAVDNFSDATSIPSFFISFIALPLATNSSEAVSAIIFASRKKRKSASLTFSELYGAVTMNNVLCLSVFLALVYLRGLTWDFSSEVLVIFLVCIIMGCLGNFQTTFPLWTAFVAFVLYPFSLVLVYVLDYVFGWS